MMDVFSRPEGFFFLFFAIIFNTVRSLNDTNITLTTTDEPFSSTLFFTTTEAPLTSTIEAITRFICLDTGDSEWSAVYELDPVDINDHAVWSLDKDSHEYNILFYTQEEQWLITEDVTIASGRLIDQDKMIAKCIDEDGLTDDPTLCVHWKLNDGRYEQNIMTTVDTPEECIVTFYSTEDGDGDSQGQKGGQGIGEVGYIGIGVSCGVLCLCIIVFIVYKTRQNTSIKQTDTGISLQPYVPSGMGYDTYKQNQTLQHQQQKRQKTPKDKLSLKKPARAPTSVASASADPPEEPESSTNANSKNALINVFDEDEGPEDTSIAIARVTTVDDAHNPFLSDGLFNTGQTMVDEPTLGTDAVMNAFDE
eukprot:78911_1